MRCEPEERDYILDALRRVFPGIAVSAERCRLQLQRHSPAAAAAITNSPAASRAAISSTASTDAVPQFCMVGGKWTTFRAFAEQTADIVLAELGRARGRRHAGRWRSAAARLSRRPGDAGSRARASATASARERAAYLVDAYGTRADDVAALLPRRDRRPAARRRQPDDGRRDRLPCPQRMRRRAGRHPAAPHVAVDHAATSRPAIIERVAGILRRRTRLERRADEPRDRDIHRPTSPTIMASRARCSIQRTHDRSM